MNSNLTQKYNDISIARHVFEIEREGIVALEDWLGEDFIKALDIISSVKGRVVLSGMGKSGHIARKIAATMASTGTPAIFVHPGEASHGDLGMITEDDVVILLSNSGETVELRDIINFCKRFAIPLIGIVRRESSILVDVSDVALVLPAVAEACHVGAPTTSTTMMLVLGDAISVALLERREFTRDQFGILHPGGKLGKSFIKVKNLVHTAKEIPLVKMDSIMSQIIKEMTEKKFGCTGVLDNDGNLVGIITDGDLRRHIDDSIISRHASDIMTKDPLTISMSSLASEALSIMEEHSITCLFVIDEGKPVGIIHIHDILRAGVA